MEEEPGVRFRSKVFAYGHFVWATKGRAPRITPEVERRLYRALIAAVESLRCGVLAIGGMPDHVHLVVRLSGVIAPAALAKQVKGSTSRGMNAARPDFAEPFDWQDGYGFFSIGQSAEEQEAVLAYVRDQKAHHAAGTLWPEWEEAREVAPPG